MIQPVDPSSPANSSIEDIQERVREAAPGRSAEDWLVGWGYDDTAIVDNRHPNREDLDAVAPDCPVVLHHISGHVAAVNTVALRQLGLMEPAAREMFGSNMPLGADGAPTGVLFESAAMHIHRRLPAPSLEEQVDRLAAVGQELLRLGITTIHDLAMGSSGFRSVEAYLLAKKRGLFSSRVRGYVTDGVLPELEAAAELFDRSAQDFRIAGVKLWADGSIQAETGYLGRPYHCSPSHHGAPLMSRDDVLATTRRLHEKGLQIAIHANGDAAIDMVIDAYRRLGAQPQGVPHRIEHFQTAREDQVDAVADLGLLPSVFVKHVKYWGDRHSDIFLGPARASRISPLASLHQRSVPFALHSDSPVTPLSPLEGIECAVTRRTMHGKVLGPDQRVSAAVAIAGYTRHAAAFAGDENSMGTLQVGMPADLVVLRHDPLTSAPDQVSSISIESTYVNGECVYSREREEM